MFSYVLVMTEMHPKYDAKPGGLHIDLQEMHTLLMSCYAKGLRSMSFCVYLKNLG